jgi:hypothetical protein
MKKWNLSVSDLGSRGVDALKASPLFHVNWAHQMGFGGS